MWMGVRCPCPPVRSDTLAKWPNVEVNMAKINKYGNFTTHPDLSSSVKLKTYQHDMLHHNANFFPISLFKADILENVKYVKNTTEILNAK